MIFNLLQPIVFFALSIAYLKIKPKEKNVAIALISFYAFYTIYSFYENLKVKCSEPVNGHLRYYWWDNVQPYASGWIFFVVMILLIYILVEDKNYGLILAAYGTGSMLLSSYLYGKYGAGVVGHMWCFYQILLPIVIYIGYKIANRMKDKK